LLFHEDLNEVIVVGTSSGGLVAQKLAEFVPERIERLVFLDALVPLPGEKIEDIVERGAGARPYQTTEFTRGPSREDLENGLFRELNGALKDWALDRATPHPLGLSDHEPGEPAAFWEKPWKATVIYCTDSPNPPEPHQRRTAERLGADWLEMTAGHYPMLTDPEETARLLQLRS
jgi:pimeloyl-ACP methyl ester carboxylesterase